METYAMDQIFWEQNHYNKDMYQYQKLRKMKQINIAKQVKALATKTECTV